MNKIYGVIASDYGHLDTSNTERGAKNYATRHGYDLVSVRYNGGYDVDLVAMKIANKWQPYDKKDLKNDY